MTPSLLWWIGFVIFISIIIYIWLHGKKGVKINI